MSGRSSPTPTSPIDVRRKGFEPELLEGVRLIASPSREWTRLPADMRDSLAPAGRAERGRTEAREEPEHRGRWVTVYPFRRLLDIEAVPCGSCPRQRRGRRRVCHFAGKAGLLAARQPRRGGCSVRHLRP